MAGCKQDDSHFNTSLNQTHRECQMLDMSVFKRPIKFFLNLESSVLSDMPRISVVVVRESDRTGEREGRREGKRVKKGE